MEHRFQLYFAENLYKLEPQINTIRGVADTAHTPDIVAQELDGFYWNSLKVMHTVVPHGDDASETLFAERLEATGNIYSVIAYTKKIMKIHEQAKAMCDHARHVTELYHQAKKSAEKKKYDESFELLMMAAASTEQALVQNGKRGTALQFKPYTKDQAYLLV